MAFLGVDLDSGDPIIREWFLVKTKFWPLFSCICYILIAKYIGVWLMKDKRPFDLRIPLLIYNGFLVSSYVTLMFLVGYYLPQIDRKLLCDISELKDEIPMKLVKYAWFCYLLKYVEYLDTIFFILRKKNHLLSNLHIVHHSIMPFIGWLVLRTERSGYQAFPAILNSLVHILMYSYYFLAALGPSVQKYLWWKKYLTMIQMSQFVIIFVFAVIITPLSGCSTLGLYIPLTAVLTALFFGLFYNYYLNAFKKRKQGTDNIKTEDMAEQCNGSRKRHRITSDDKEEDD